MVRLSAEGVCGGLLHNAFLTLFGMHARYSKFSKGLSTGTVSCYKQELQKERTAKYKKLPKSYFYSPFVKQNSKTLLKFPKLPLKNILNFIYHCYQISQQLKLISL